MANPITYQQKHRQQYEEKIASMNPSTNLQTWALFMTVKYGDEVMLDHDKYSDWILCLMYIMYGGIETEWPTEFSERDQLRAELWYKGKKPGGIRYKTADGFAPDMSSRLLS